MDLLQMTALFHIYWADILSIQTGNAEQTDLHVYFCSRNGSYLTAKGFFLYFAHSIIHRGIRNLGGQGKSRCVTQIFLTDSLYGS